VGAPDAIVVNGAAFSASIPEAEWVVPAAGRGAEIGLALEISNRGPEPLVFDLHDTVWVEMSLDGVEWRRMDGGRNGSRAAPTLSRPIAPGETLRVERPARLEARADGVRLIGDDPFGGVWHVDAVPIGAVWFRFWYMAAPDGDRGARVWAGDARTRPVRVRVREQEGDEP